MSTLYRDRMTDGELNLLLEIEAEEPSIVLKSSILGPLHSFYKEEQRIKSHPNSADHYKKKMAQQLEKYTIAKYKTKNYLQELAKIEKYFQGNTAGPGSAASSLLLTNILYTLRSSKIS